MEPNPMMMWIKTKNFFAAGLMTLSLGFTAALAEPDYGELVLGNPDASVTVVDYSSLTCPACAKFHNDTLPRIKQEYVDTGKIKFVFKDMPLDSPAAAAAMLARCAGRDARMGLLDLLFAEQTRWRKGATGEEFLNNLTGLLEGAGLSKSEAEACMADEKLFKTVLDEREQGVTIDKVEATPTIFVNGEKHTGALSYDELKKLIDAQL
tara:strand:+ start:54 stop:677 length:624 start_codon:yes stop_codon:yes gene_type:complete